MCLAQALATALNPNPAVNWPPTLYKYEQPTFDFLNEIIMDEMRKTGDSDYVEWSPWTGISAICWWNNNRTHEEVVGVLKLAAEKAAALQA